MSVASVEAKIKSVMEAIGHDFLKGLSEVEKYLPEAEALALIIFPKEVAVIGGVVNVVGLVQKAVVTVEQKMVAAGQTEGTGVQKAADVLSITSAVALDTLKQAGVSADTSYLQKIINAVVAILNVKSVTVVAAPVVPAAPAGGPNS